MDGSGVGDWIVRRRCTSAAAADAFGDRLNAGVGAWQALVPVGVERWARRAGGRCARARPSGVQEPGERVGEDRPPGAPPPLMDSPTSPTTISFTPPPPPHFPFQNTHRAIRLLGRGAYADTWLFCDVAHQRLVAIKLFKRPIKAESVPAILREIGVQCELGPANIHLIEVYEALLTDTHLGLVMEYAAGGRRERGERVTGVRAGGVAGGVAAHGRRHTPGATPQPTLYTHPAPFPA